MHDVIKKGEQTHNDFYFYFNWKKKINFFHIQIYTTHAVYTQYKEQTPITTAIQGQVTVGARTLLKKSSSEVFLFWLLQRQLSNHFINYPNIGHWKNLCVFVICIIGAALSLPNPALFISEIIHSIHRTASQTSKSMWNAAVQAGKIISSVSSGRVKSTEVLPSLTWGSSSFRSELKKRAIKTM